MKRGIDYIGVGVGAIIVNERGEVFLAKRGPLAKNERGLWEFPGGSVEFGERLADALKREIQEEYGVDIAVGPLLDVVDHILSAEGQHWVSPTYLCTVQAGEPRILEPGKCTEIGWFLPEQAPNDLTSITRQNLRHYLEQQRNEKPARASQHFAYFITPHGYGHAARASAVMNAIHERHPEAIFEIFTSVPIWFFNMSLRGGFNYHKLVTDIGLVQSSPMLEDLPETIHRLEAMLPYRPELTHNLAKQITQIGCEMVLCDIAPLGIAVAKAAGLPSVLMENFTWDWIYEGYLAEEPRFAPYIAYLRETFASADHHIRTEPACSMQPPADLLTGVVSRKARVGREQTREQLGIAPEAPLVMITMGGIVTAYPFLDRLEHSANVRFLIPGSSEQHEQRGSMLLLPHHSHFYHPDLVAASDVVVGKLGYSTLAEAYTAGTPFAFIPRERFRESAPMGRYAREEMSAMELSEASFFSGEWIDLLPELIARPKRKSLTPNGADEISGYIEQIRA